MLQKSWSTTIEDAPDGSGDGILTFPDWVIEDRGWKEGTILHLRIENTPSGNVLVISESK